MSVIKNKKRINYFEEEKEKEYSKNMLVAVRIRPLTQREKDNENNICCNVINNNIVTIRKEGNTSMYLKSQQGRYSFLFLTYFHLISSSTFLFNSISLSFSIFIWYYSVNEYCFDHAFDIHSTQIEIYEKTTKKFIPSLIDGFNVTVFAYGATGYFLYILSFYLLLILYY